MSESKHTPGPWVTDAHVRNEMVLGPDGAYVADCCILASGNRRTGEVNAANARLISAAPTLLYACEGLVRYAEAVRHIAGMGANQLARLESAKAAIAKAKGSP